MTRENRALRIWILGFAVAGLYGCASRGYVRTQVDTSARTLSAEVEENRTQIEETRQGLNTLKVNADETHRLQADELRRAEEAIETTRDALEETQGLAENARRIADAATVQGQALSRLFDDRGLFEVRLSHEILFNFDSSEIGEQHHQQLEAVASLLTSDPNTLLVLEGRTDSLGDADYNTLLGERRVRAAKDYLIMELGVPIYRIHGFSYGESRPTHDDSNAENRAKNRSVTALVMGPRSEVTLAAADPE